MLLHPRHHVRGPHADPLAEPERTQFTAVNGAEHRVVAEAGSLSDVPWAEKTLGFAGAIAEQSSGHVLMTDSEASVAAEPESTL